MSAHNSQSGRGHCLRMLGSRAVAKHAQICERSICLSERPKLVFDCLSLSTTPTRNMTYVSGSSLYFHTYPSATPIIRSIPTSGKLLFWQSASVDEWRHGTATGSVLHGQIAGFRNSITSASLNPTRLPIAESSSFEGCQPEHMAD